MIPEVSSHKDGVLAMLTKYLKVIWLKIRGIWESILVEATGDKLSVV
jgi:hypothetical protein